MTFRNLFFAALLLPIFALLLHMANEVDRARDRVDAIADKFEAVAGRIDTVATHVDTAVGTLDTKVETAVNNAVNPLPSLFEKPTPSPKHP